MDAYIGIDLGTSSVKTVAIDEDGSVIATSSRSYSAYEPHPGWREIDPFVWWVAACETLSDVNRMCGRRKVRAIGVTGQMHSIVPMDERGAPLGRAILWSDHRTASDVSRARDALRKAGENYLAEIISTGSPALNLMWLHDNKPEVFCKMRTFAIGPDWIVHCLTGAYGTDYCEASTSSIFDLTSSSWSSAACEALGIPMSILPHVQASEMVVGGVVFEASRLTGLAEGIPVIRGTGDNPAAAIPTGCLTKGTPIASLGTSGVLMYARKGRFIPSCGKAVQFASTDDTISTLVQMTLQTCGNAMDWLTKEILGRPCYEFSDPNAADISYDVGRLLFYPFLNGDKTLYADPEIRASFVGMSLDTTSSDMQRAVMEGICMGLRQLLERVEGSCKWSEIGAIGGGSNSDLWMKILATVLQRPVVRFSSISGASQGAAMLAMAAVEGVELAKMVVELDTAHQVFVPEASLVNKYNERYARYLELHDALLAF